MKFDTPVLFLIFNRLETALRVFGRIRDARPARVFIAADGPRSSVAGEREQCIAVREQVMKMIDWPCEVKTLFRDDNLGCAVAVSNAITWYFTHVEEGIVLEDDCLPSPSFFPYCQELLHRYRQVHEIMHISGDNFQEGRIRGDASYYFSIYNHNWGWATWRDRWQKYDFDMKPFDMKKVTSYLQTHRLTEREIRYWTNVFERVTTEPANTWDYQWIYATWKNNGICILPNVNLVQNIGFGPDATHTKDASNHAIREVDIVLPLTHPEKIEVDHKADSFAFQHFHKTKSFGKIMTDKIKNSVRKALRLARKVKFRLIRRKFDDFTMIPVHAFVANLELVYRFRGVGGVVVECGTWKGGMIAAIAEILGTGREYHLFDSFEGLPEAKDIDGPAAKSWQADKDGAFYHDNCLAAEEDAAEAMKRSGATQYFLHKGWFNATLPGFGPKGGIAVLRLDGDWYDSTMECLTNLFPKVNQGGVVIIDDYYMWDGCSRAVHDYLSASKSNCRIESFRNVCYIIKK